LRDDSGSIVVKPSMDRKGWKEYMEHLLNVGNLWDGMAEGERNCHGNCCVWIIWCLVAENMEYLKEKV